MKEILRNLDTWGPRGPQGYVLPYIFLTIKAAAPSFHVFVRNIVGVGVENEILKKVQNFKFYNEIIRGVHADPKKNLWYLLLRRILTLLLRKR